MCLPGGGIDHREPDDHPCANTLLAFDIKPPAVAFNYVFHNRKAKSGSA